jgi:hypothetical protein
VGRVLLGLAGGVGGVAWRIYYPGVKGVVVWNGKCCIAFLHFQIDFTGFAIGAAPPKTVPRGRDSAIRVV